MTSQRDTKKNESCPLFVRQRRGSNDNVNHEGAAAVTATMSKIVRLTINKCLMAVCSVGVHYSLHRSSSVNQATRIFALKDILIDNNAEELITIDRSQALAICRLTAPKLLPLFSIIAVIQVQSDPSSTITTSQQLALEVHAVLLCSGFLSLLPRPPVPHRAASMAVLGWHVNLPSTVTDPHRAAF